MENLHATEGKFFQSIKNSAPSKELRTQIQVLVCSCLKRFLVLKEHRR